MGIGQIPPQNVIRLLLCWTTLANRTKTIHASTCTFARTQYNWGKTTGDQSGRFAYREGVKHICVYLSSTVHSGGLQLLQTTHHL